MAITHVEFFGEAADGASSVPVADVSWAIGDYIAVVFVGRDANARPSSITNGPAGVAARLVVDSAQGVNMAALWEGVATDAGSVVDLTVVLNEAVSGGSQVTVLVISGDDPVFDASASADTGATDTTTPSVDLTTVAAATRRYAFFTHRHRVFTVDSGDGLTAIRENDLISTGGNVCSTSSYFKNETSAGSKNASGTLDIATDWLAIAFSVTEAGAGGTVTITPDPVILPLVVPAPTLQVGRVVTPSPVAIPLVLPAPVLAVGRVLTPDPVAIPLVLPDVVVSTAAGVTVTPDPVVLLLVVPAPTLQVGRVLTPDPVTIPLVIPAASLVVGRVLTPDPVTVVLAIPAPTVTSFSGTAGPAGSPHEYVVELFNSNATFGPNAKLGEVWDARNIGWSRYDRIPGKAFFTLPQSSPLLSLLTPLTTHVAIQRISPAGVTQVFGGVFVDYDSSGDDVVCMCFDYLALLSVSRTGYRVLYPQRLIGTEIVLVEWDIAENAASSPLGFLAALTIENPLGTDGSTPIKTNNQFGLLDQMRLELFYDLSEIGRANTANHVTFHITRQAPYTFSFFKNAGVLRDFGLVLGGNVSDYRHVPGWRHYRNNLATIGSTIGGGATEVVVNNAAEVTARGLRQDVFTLKTLLGIVGLATEADQQKAAAERVLRTAVSLHPTLLLRLVRNTIEPFAGWDIGDKVPVEISNGIDELDEAWRIVGTRAFIDEAGETPSLLVQPVAV